MQSIQIVDGASGRSPDVSPAIVPIIHLHAIGATSSRNKLPESRGSAMRVGERVECAFNDG